MRTTACFLMLACAAFLFVMPSAVSQTKTDQSGVITPDSAKKYSKIVFQKNCSGCHGEKGQGTVGPNLTDKYWLHGGGLKNVCATVRDGVAGKGMISWNAVFSTEEIQRISEYVIAMQGTDPPKAKKAEGELFEDQKK